MAAEMGIELLTEVQYRELSLVLGRIFDTRTSSWVQTASDIRELGGALFSGSQAMIVAMFQRKE